MSPRFGRCPYFLIINTETHKVEAVENKGVRATHGAGVSAAQIVSDSGCQVIITGNVGPNAFSVLNTTGIKIFVSAFGKTCEQVLREYNNGDLDEVEGARPCSPGRGRGFGRGGRGRGAN